jgi:hypothetical protein
VRKNLPAALLQLWSSHDGQVQVRGQIMDWLTINQDNEEEKSDQILIMHQIYQSAGNILVWLGAEVEQTFDEEGYQSKAARL